MRWIEALKVWNRMKKEIDPSHCWCVPRKGEPEHAQVLDIIARKRPKAIEAENIQRAAVAKEQLAAVGKAFAEKRAAQAAAKVAVDEERAAKLKGLAEKAKRLAILKQLRELAEKVKERKAAAATAAAEAAPAPRPKRRVAVLPPPPPAATGGAGIAEERVAPSPVKTRSARLKRLEGFSPYGRFELGEAVGRNIAKTQVAMAKAGKGEEERVKARAQALEALREQRRQEAAARAAEVAKISKREIDTVRKDVLGGSKELTDDQIANHIFDAKNQIEIVKVFDEEGKMEGTQPRVTLYALKDVIDAHSGMTLGGYAKPVATSPESKILQAYAQQVKFKKPIGKISIPIAYRRYANDFMVEK